MAKATNTKKAAIKAAGKGGAPKKAATKAAPAKPAKAAKAVPIKKDSAPITKLDEGEQVDVTRVYRRDDGVMRLCFSKPGLQMNTEGTEPRVTDATQELWVSERHSENSCHRAVQGALRTL